MTNKELHASQEKLAQKLDAVIPHLEAIATTVRSLDKTVNGNGQPGLITEVARVKTIVKIACAVGGAVLIPFIPFIPKIIRVLSSG